MNSARWIVHNPRPASEKLLSEELGVSEIVSGILVDRGMEEPSACRKFLSASTGDMHDPFELKDMGTAVRLIRDAAGAGRKVIVYGDFDADGITSAALLIRTLRDTGIRAEYYIPHRLREGYGLNEEAVELAARKKAGMLITVDCGISSIKEVIRARRLGMEVIITDHHEPTTVALPPAGAILNPLQYGCGYPFRHLAGAGIALKLAEALVGRDKALGHVDLAALGTIADVAPLTGENRIIAKHGLSALSKTDKPGLASLVRASGTGGRDLTVSDLAFVIGPRINAPGRLDSAVDSVELLLAEDARLGDRYARSLEENNRKRQKLQKEILGSAVKKIDLTRPQPLIALSDESWHPGLIGIIASKLCEEYSRPAVLISADREVCRGSARSGENFHMLSALTECRKLLRDLGGHSRAAGFSISRKNISRFITRIKGVGESRAGRATGEEVTIDREIKLSEVSEALISELEMLRPFGEGNPEPLFLARGVSFRGVRCLKDRHLKARCADGTAVFDSIGFGLYENTPGENGRADIVFIPRINRWNGREELQLMLKGIKPL